VATHDKLARELVHSIMLVCEQERVAACASSSSSNSRRAGIWIQSQLMRRLGPMIRTRV